MATVLDNRDASTLMGLAASINGNLRQFRGKTPAEIERELTVELHAPTPARDSSERAARVLRAALAGVDLCTCSAKITDSCASLRLLGSSTWLDVDLGPALRVYIEEGAQSRSSRSR